MMKKTEVSQYSYLHSHVQHRQVLRRHVALPVVKRYETSFHRHDKEVKKAERSFVPCKPVIWLKVNWLNDFKPTCNGNISWSKRQNQCDNEVDLLSGINCQCLSSDAASA